MRLDLTLAQIEAVRVMLADEADDERLLADTLEGETDAYEVVRRLLNAIEREEGDRAALTEQMDARKARRDRCVDRIAQLRRGVGAVLHATGLPKMQLPEATVTVRDGKARLIVLSDDAVPDQYQVTKRTPDKQAINAAFEDADELPNWLVREPSVPTLTVRRK